jgi:hypothetical protein
MSTEKLTERLPERVQEERDEDPLSHAARTYLYFLRVLFESRPAGYYRWTEDNETTEVLIADQGPVGIEVMDRIPAVISERGDFSFSAIALDQHRFTNPTTGDREHADLLSGNMVIHCVAREGLEATRLACIVARGIIRFRRELTILGGFHEIRPNVVIGRESPAGALVEGDSDYNFVDVPVQSPLHLRETWGIGAIGQDVIKSIEGKLVAQPSLETLLCPEQKARTVRDPTYQGTLLREVGDLDQSIKI